MPIPSISVGGSSIGRARSLGILTLPLHAFDLQIGPDSRQHRTDEFEKGGTSSNAPHAVDPNFAALQHIARSGGAFRRMAARIPTYLTDLRENPARLPMFLLARTMPFRKAHRLTARPVHSTASAGPSMFGHLRADAIAAELRRTGIFAALALPAPILEEIARFGRETPCFGNFERKLDFWPVNTQTPSGASAARS